MYISTATVSIATKLGRVMTYRDGLLHKFTLTIDCVVLQGRVTNKNHYIHYQSLYGHQT